MSYKTGFKKVNVRNTKDSGGRDMANKNTHDELLPCPCCGSAAKLNKRSSDYFSNQDHTKIYYTIKCTRCPLKTGTFQDKNKLILGWNTRVNKGVIAEYVSIIDA